MQLDVSTKKILEKAEELAQSGTGIVTSLHLFVSIFNHDCLAKDILLECNFTTDKIEKYLLQNTTIYKEKLSPLVESILNEASEIAQKIGSEKISSVHLLLAILAFKSGQIDYILDSNGVSRNFIYAEILKYFPDNYNLADYLGFTKDSSGEELMSIDDFCINMIKEAENFAYERAIGREEETESIIKILNRKNKNNVCLVGEAGVGKTAIVENLAIKISEGNVPASLKNKIIYSLNMGTLIAGTKYRGEFEEKLSIIMRQAVESENIILFIDEIHTLMGAGAGSGNSLDAANILKPALARGNVQLIGATTHEEYSKYIENDSAFERRLTKLVVKEPSVEATIKILEGISENFERYHRISISKSNIKLCVELADRYITDRKFPDKAIDILDEACSKFNIKNVQKTSLNNIKIKINPKTGIVSNWKSLIENNVTGKDFKFLTDDYIYQVISEHSNIEVDRIKQSKDSYKDISKNLTSKIYGQNDVIEKVSNSIKRAQLGLNSDEKPISFMFCGSSGVGKTYLAKELASILFLSDKNLITIDMSEYMEPHSVSKLIGSPPGYVGFEKKGQLTEKIRINPYSLILFDEVEKAHIDVLNLLLRILDEGKINDSTGREINFRNSIIIFTTNIGTNNVTNKTSLGFNNKDNSENYSNQIKDSIKKYFKPEFINRIDDIIIFNKLDDITLKNIIDSQLQEFNELLIKKQNIVLCYTDDLLDFILKSISSKGLGARPVKRIIDELIKTEVANCIISSSKQLKKINISITNNKINFEKED